MTVRDKVKRNVELEAEELRTKQDQDGQVEERQQSKKKAVPIRKQKFLALRMWINYLASSLQKDRGVIPTNIGDRILISNNIYATKYYLSSVIHVETLTLDTPITFVSELNRELREKESTAVLDVVFKNEPFIVDLLDSGLESRERMWKNALQLEGISAKEKEAAARCLYTKQQVEQGAELKQTRIFITLRAKTGTELTNAERIVYAYLRNKLHAEFKQVTGNLKEVLKYTTIISDFKDTNVKDWKTVINSEKTLAQMMPNSGSFEGKKGDYIGINILNGSEFRIDWDSITMARNCYVCKPSGGGKTVLAMNACQSAVENGRAVCVMDIKGNEFNTFIKGTGGYIVSLRETSSGYINSWRMKKEDTTDANADMYFKQRLAFSKEQMIILSGVQDDVARLELEELLDSFHNSLYLSMGVSSTNRNTWKLTDELNPYVVYEALRDYMTPEVQRLFPRVTHNVMNALRMTMSKEGSKSYIFKHEFDYMAIMNAPTLMFDFGIIGGNHNMVDPIIYKLKFAYMRRLNAEYVTFKHSKGIKVFKILEESQIAVSDPDIMKGYIEEFTLRRAQGQTTWLLGNSIEALLTDGLCKSLIENTTGLFVGQLTAEARKTVISKFGLEEYQDLFEYHCSDNKFKNSFIFFDKMRPNPAIPIIKVKLRDEEHGGSYLVNIPTKQNDKYLG